MLDIDELNVGSSLVFESKRKILKEIKTEITRLGKAANKIKKFKKCPNCDGEGEEISVHGYEGLTTTDICERCGGTGKFKELTISK